MVDPAVTPDALLAQLDASPKDPALRERAARALVQDGRHAEAIETLRAGFLNLTAHEKSPLPCLCRKCLVPAAGTASGGAALSFRREFAVASGRVLYFWMPDELDRDRDGVRASVRAALETRLAKLERERKRRRRRG